MKLKSKLIATIVSICAAIAVMGVGVWAATASFTINVTNKVNFQVNNLAGTIKVTGAATVDGTAKDTGYTNKLADEPLFDSATATAPYETAIGTTAAHKYDGAGLFDKEATGYGITADTKAASIAYTFTYTPPTGTAGQGYTTVTLTMGESLPTLGSVTGATMKTSYVCGSQSASEMTNGQEVKLYAPAGQAITITITCTYENANQISVNASGSFDFTLVFASSASNDGFTSIA